MCGIRERGTDYGRKEKVVHKTIDYDPSGSRSAVFGVPHIMDAPQLLETQWGNLCMAAYMDIREFQFESI